MPHCLNINCHRFVIRFVVPRVPFSMLKPRSNRDVTAKRYETSMGKIGEAFVETFNCDLSIHWWISGRKLRCSTTAILENQAPGLPIAFKRFSIGSRETRFFVRTVYGINARNMERKISMGK